MNLSRAGGIVQSAACVERIGRHSGCYFVFYGRLVLNYLRGLSDEGGCSGDRGRN